MDSNNVAKIQLSEYTPKSDREKVDRKGWVNYGDDNLFPQYLRDLSQTSPVHGSLTVAISDMIAGKGIVSANYQDQLDALNINEVLKASAYDLKLFGGFFLEVIWSNDRSVIAKINHLPFDECRIAINEEDETEIGIYHSYDWANTRKKKNIPAFIPKYNVLHKSDEPIQVYMCSTYTGSLYYPRPDYWSGVNFIELEKRIGIFHVNNLANGMFPSMLISFKNGTPTPEQKQMMMRDWEQKLSGERNAGKFIMLFGERDVEHPQITTLPLSDADKMYDVLNGTSTSKIIQAHRVTTPLLFGIRDAGGGFGSNKDEMETGLEIFTKQVIEPYQRKLTETFEYLLQAQLPNVAFEIIPNTPLQSKQSVISDGATTTADVAATALNGAQIASLVDIVMQSAAGAVPVSSAKAIVTAAFPTLPLATVDAIFADVIAGSLQPTEVIQSQQLKKKVAADFDDHKVAEALISLGEDKPDDWILIDAYDVDYDNDDYDNESIASHNFVSTGTARPNAKSTQDETIEDVKFYTRYKYNGEIRENSREFCRKMLNADKLYRKEDIMQMGKQIVNEGWGPRGADKYSIWLYKGGGACFHTWRKMIYASAKGFGLDLTNPNIKEAMDVRVRKAGYKVRNNYLVEVAPRDMPNQGFLPDNPRVSNK